MIYIVPDWPNKIEELTNDPLRHLVNILMEGNKDIKMLFLNFMPNLRHVLNINSLVNVDFWNVWDDILDIKRRDGIPLQPEELDLPENIDLLYSVNKIMIYSGEEYRGQIFVNNEGYVSEVKINENGRTRTDVYDDRGFKIQSKYYFKEVVEKIEWFNEYGEGVLIYDPKAEKKVKIQLQQDRFARSEYSDIDELLADFLKRTVNSKKLVEDDVFVTTVENPSKIIIELMQETVPVNYILSTASNVDDEIFSQENAHFFVSSEYILEDLNKKYKAMNNVGIGFPYGAHMWLGNSNEENKLNVYWKINNGDTEVRLVNGASEVAEYIEMHEEVEVTAESENLKNANVVAGVFFNNILKKYEFIQELDRDSLMKIFFLRDPSEELQKFMWKVQTRITEEIKLGQKKVDSKIINWDEFMSYISSFHIYTRSKSYQVRNDMDRMRVIIDISEPCDTLTQFNAISAGIPQINQVKSSLVVDKRNGWIIKDGRTITQGLDYFLYDLRNWNQSLVDLVRLMEQYSVKQQADWWERKLYGKD